MLIIQARCDKAQEFDGSRIAVAKDKVNVYVHVNSMRCCTDIQERSLMDEQLHTSLRSLLCSAHVLSYFHPVIYGINVWYIYIYIYIYISYYTFCVLPLIKFVNYKGGLQGSKE